MADKAWKAFERRVAYFFGCKRTGPMQAKDENDLNHPHIHCQCKHSKRHAIIGVWDAAKKQTEKSGKIPVVALGVRGRPGFWLLVHSSDLVAVSRRHENAAGCYCPDIITSPDIMFVG